jgi:hypothetical protein
MGFKAIRKENQSSQWGNQGIKLFSLRTTRQEYALLVDGLIYAMDE